MIAVGHERSESGPASALDRKSIKVDQFGTKIIVRVGSGVAQSEYHCFLHPSILFYHIRESFPILTSQEWNVYWQNRKSSESEGLKSEDPNSAEGQRISAKYKEVIVVEFFDESG